MLRLVAAQAEALWDEALPSRSGSCRRISRRWTGFCAIRGCWRRLWSIGGARLLSGVSAADHGGPTLAIETYVRLMVLTHRYG
jgi:hypothetical protein